MKILGIDPGTATTGFGVIEFEQGKTALTLDYGVVATDKNLPMSNRLAILYDDLSAIITQHRPDVVAVEQLFFARNVTTAIAVGQARGVVLLVVARARLPIVEYTPLQVKQAVTGYGRADKKQVQHMVQSILHLKSLPRPDDAADALAIAITHSATIKH